LVSELQVKIDLGFGELVVSASTPEELLETLRRVDGRLVDEARRIASQMRDNGCREVMNSILRDDGDGLRLVFNDGLTQYEAIGIILYMSENHSMTLKEIREILRRSGFKAVARARIHEMVKRGLVYRPVEGEPVYRLSDKGLRWIEEAVMPKLKPRVY